MEMSEENYRIERQRCLKQMNSIRIEKGPHFFASFLKIKVLFTK